MAFLVLHGWQGSEGDHWQAWLAGRLAAAGEDVRFPALPDRDRPQLDAWVAAIAAERTPGETVVCHSLACCAWLHHRARGGPPAARALLVAPPCLDPAPREIAGFFPVPRDPALGAGARLVCSDDDPYCPAGAAAVYGTRLGVPVDLLPGAGLVNPDSGYGPWPAVLEWCRGERDAVG